MALIQALIVEGAELLELHQSTTTKIPKLANWKYSKTYRPSGSAHKTKGATGKWKTQKDSAGGRPGQAEKRGKAERNYLKQRKED